MAAAEDERFGELGIIRAKRKGSVGHVGVQEVGMVAAGGGHGGEVGVEEEIRGSGGGGGGGGGGAEASKVGEGGAYGVELVAEVVGNRCGRRRRLGLNSRRQVVKGEDVCGHHGH